MMNPNTMTIDECRDWLARDEGWIARKNGSWDRPTQSGLTHAGSSRVREDTWSHPFPPTLDAAARALPDNADARADTELLARFRLAVACRMASKETK